MDFYDTEKVNVFPSSFRKTETKSKYTSEHNFVNILNSLIDRDCYVLSYDRSSDLLKIVLHGYYFEVDKFIQYCPGHPCYASIRVEEGSYSALVNYDNSASTSTSLDDGGKFRGIKFTQGRPTDANSNASYTYYTLQITKENDQGGYDIINKVRLSTDSIYFTTGDDLTKMINSKQNNLTAKDGIKLDPTTSEIGLEDKIYKTVTSMASKNVGANNKFIYIKNGEATASGANVGSKYTTSGNYNYTQNTYTENGELKGGTTFFASKGDPNSTLGSNGDFWFKYTD